MLFVRRTADTRDRIDDYVFRAGQLVQMPVQPIGMIRIIQLLDQNRGIHEEGQESLLIRGNPTTYGQMYLPTTGGPGYTTFSLAHPSSIGR